MVVNLYLCFVLGRFVGNARNGEKSRNQDARRNRNACCWGRETGEGETENRGGCQTEENKKKMN